MTTETRDPEDPGRQGHGAGDPRGGRRGLRRAARAARHRARTDRGAGRRGPGLADLRAQQGEGGAQGRHELQHRAPARHDDRGRAAGDRRAAQRRPGGPRHPGPAAAARRDRRTAVIEAIDPRKDVDGFHPENVGPAADRPARFRPLHAGGDHRAAETERDPAERASTRWSSAAATSWASRWRCCCCASTAPSRSATRERSTCRSRRHGRHADRRRGPAGDGDAAISSSPGAAVVDVGMHRVEDEATCRELFGDDEKRLTRGARQGRDAGRRRAPARGAGRAGWLTPVPGGVGPLTIAMLLKNTLDAARRSVDWSTAE